MKWQKIDVDELFLGEVGSGEDPWMADISIRGSTVSFEIDTGTHSHF